MQKRRLSGGLCLAFDYDQKLLTISRQGNLTEIGTADNPPSATERLGVMEALERALATAEGWVNGQIAVNSSDLLYTKSSTGYWFMYRLRWEVPAKDLMSDERKNSAGRVLHGPAGSG